jgi:hypothetical protein
VSDLAGCPATDIFFEDPAHDPGFACHDLELAGLARHRPIAICAPASMTPVPYDPVHPPANLISKIGKIERSEQTPHANLHLVGRPFVDRAELDACEGQTLPYPG